MNIITIGTGYVGLITATCLAELGNTVIGVDIDKQKVQKLQKGIIPIYEPGLEEMVRRNKKAKRLRFSTSIENSMNNADVIFIAVGTPPKRNGEADLQYVKAVAENIGKNIDDYTIIVNKSTVPIGTGNLVAKIIKKHYKGDFDVVSNPEFLREGVAIEDFMKPDRVVIGNGSEQAEKIMRELYKPLKCPIINTSLETAEMIKYASNSLLATEISFINSISNLCEKLGADVTKVSEGMRYDKRIGKTAFLDAGPGYGGSCFPKDVKALIKISKKYKTPFPILEEVDKTNEKQKESIVHKVKALIGPLNNKTIAIWGLSFKPQTDDMREAPAIIIVNNLIKEGVIIRAFDPVAQSEAKKVLKNIRYYDSPYTVVKNAHALVIITEWNEFIQINKKKILNLMKEPNIIDTRNIYDVDTMNELGFNYTSIGRPSNIQQTKTIIP